MPTLASSSAGFTMAGSGKSSGTGSWSGTCQRGIGRPAACSTALSNGLRWQTVIIHADPPVYGIPASSMADATLYSHWLVPPTPSHRLNTRSTPLRMRSNHSRFPCTGTFATSCPAACKAALTSRTGSRTDWTSSGLQSSAPPSYSTTILTGARSPWRAATRCGLRPGSARRSSSRPRRLPRGGSCAPPDRA